MLFITDWRVTLCYWHAFFPSQQVDKGVHREAFQKSLVLLTKLPLYSLFNQYAHYKTWSWENDDHESFFSRLIQICGELFFQNGFSTLVSFYEDISKWYIHHLPFHSSRPFPKVGDQLSLHACNHVCFVWQTPTIRFFLWQFHKISQPSKSSNSIKKNGRKTIPNSIPIHGLSLRLWESPMNLDLNINALTLSRL